MSRVVLPMARDGSALSPEIARLIIAIARDLAREDHEHRLAADNVGPALACPITLIAD
jgi:hypothetical protein